MSWVKISDQRYENTELGQYTSYLPRSDSHEHFWYLHDMATTKPLDGKITLLEFGIPPEVIGEGVINPNGELITQMVLFPEVPHEASPEPSSEPKQKPQSSKPKVEKRAAEEATPATSPTPAAGHNSGLAVATDRLRSIIERIERLDEELKAIGGDKKDIFVEAKSAGFDVKVVRDLLRIRKQEPSEVEEREMLLDVYRRALGM